MQLLCVHLLSIKITTQPETESQVIETTKKSSSKTSVKSKSSKTSLKSTSGSTSVSVKNETTTEVLEG